MTYPLPPNASRRGIMLTALLLAGALAPFPAFSARPAPTVITLGNKVDIEGDGATAAAGHVQITAGGVYEVSGELADGQIEVDAPDADVEVILAGATIVSSDGPAILFRDAGSAALTLAPGTENRVEDGGDTDFDAAIAANLSLTIGGDGALEVRGIQNEGIASSMHLTFTGGDIHVWAVEDGVNANNDDVSEITITGGTLVVETETGDGIDSNGTITITGGDVTTLGAMADRNGGLDADGAITIDGGKVIATGARQPAPAEASLQQSLLLQFDQTQDADTLIVIQDPSGNDLFVFAPATPFRQLLVSDPVISPGETYSVYLGGTAEGDAVDGRYAAASNSGEFAGTVTTASLDVARQERGPGR